MPGVEDWINNPLEIVQKIFIEQEHTNCHNSVVQYFRKYLNEKDKYQMIPSLNDISVQHLKPNSLVRFRCMIQDMFDPEFYFEMYEVKDKYTNQCALKCGLYKDTLDCKQTEEIIIHSPRNVNGERLNYYCISVPGENTWVKSEFRQLSKSSMTVFYSSKRPLGDDDVDYGIEVETKKRRSGEDIAEKTGDLQSTFMNELPYSNFSQLENNEIACIVKLYDIIDQFTVTDVIECIGILDIYSESKSDTEDDEDDNEMMSQIQSFSSIPKIHAIRINLFQHNNPHFPIEINLENELGMEIFSNAKRIKKDLVECLSHILFGDKLSAEYLLFNLISSVYYQQNLTTLGKLCVNLTNIPAFTGYVKNLFNILQKLTTKSYFLELSLQNLNSIDFIPRKDYTSNHLISSILQLSAHTHLLIDETALSPGELNNKGVNNISALNHLIKWQQVEYDFKYHRIPYSSNISVLVVSQGKSMLSSDCQVKICETLSQDNWKDYFTEIENFLNGEILKQFQDYLTLMKIANYTLHEDMQKIIQEDFVNMRKADSLMTGDDLHHLLVLARFQSLSCGEKFLNRENWEIVKAMEVERKRRLNL